LIAAWKDVGIAGILKESNPHENRVAVVPTAAAALRGKGIRLLFESHAGLAAGFPDDQYRAAGAEIAGRAEIFSESELLLAVRMDDVAPGRAAWEPLRAGQVLVGMADALWKPEVAAELARRRVTAFALDLIPRITRAQSMDVLSSMATVAGYKAALIAAMELPKMFPLLMTAAGTSPPARVFVLGAGVAGLQAIATSRQLGAVVEAYDVRPAAREEIESLGARALELPLGVGDPQDERGYARPLGDDANRRQRDLLAKVLPRNDVVITTAAVPGSRPPLLINEAMVEAMMPGSVLVDLAAERGGNCELTRPGETIRAHGVTLVGAVNLPSTVPHDASRMYSHNVSSFLLHLWQSGRLGLDRKDPIVAETLLSHDGEVVQARLRELLGMPSSTRESLT
jgi:NAD(P) transhydrogenase subunit alpha